MAKNEVTREEFFDAFRWECEKWVTEHLLFYWIKENKNEFVEKILEESFQETKIQNPKKKGDISGLIKKKILEAYQETNDKVYKLLSKGEKHDIETFEDKFRIWAIIYIGLREDNKFFKLKKKQKRDNEKNPGKEKTKKNRNYDFDHIYATEESLKLFHKYLKTDDRTDLLELAEYSAKSAIKYIYKQMAPPKSENDKKKENKNNGEEDPDGPIPAFPKSLIIKEIEEYTRTIDTDNLDLIKHTLRLIDEIMELKGSIFTKIIRLVIFYCVQVNLTTKQAYSLILHMEGKTNKTIAELCQIRESTVSQTIITAFENLRLCLDEM